MRLILTVILSLILLIPQVPVKAKEPFTKGVNLTKWFQTSSVRSIQFNKYTKKDFQDIKSLGCDVIRFPINLHAMTGGAPDYQLDPLFIRYLDGVVNNCDELGLSLILDNHSFDPAINTKASVEKVLLKVWAQMAEHYKDRGDFLYYEILNEPHGLDPRTWGKIELNVLKKIREIDQKHTVIVGGANSNDIDSMYLLPDFKDDNIIYTFHFYDPLIFTHQGANWTGPSLAPLKGVPYPYDRARMPSCPMELRNTWLEGSFYDYSKKGNNEALEKLLMKAVEFRNKTGKPVYCGEFGVYNQIALNEDRVYWYESVRKILEKYSIPWTSWDYRNEFGLFIKDSDELFEHDLNIPLLKALGFNEVPQVELKNQPETGGFYLFNQYPAEGILVSGNFKHGELDFYNDTITDDQRYAIEIGNFDRYDSLSFDFKPGKNLSLLSEKNYNLVMRVKLKPRFKNAEIRFLAVRKDDPLARPWRMGYTLDEKFLKNTTEWQTIIVPLKDFTERGAWKFKWYNPEGLFDWSRVVGFEVVAENEGWPDTGIYIKEIKISGEVNEEH